MTEPLNILMITHHRRYRTGPRSLIMAQHLTERGHKVKLVVTADNNRFRVSESEVNGVQIVEMPDLLWGRLRSGWDLWNMINRDIYLKREKTTYDLVHCFETRPNTIYPALHFAKDHQLPLLTDWNDWFGRGGLIEVLRPHWYRVLFTKLETFYEEAFRTRADGLTVICSALAERAEKLGVPADRICLISGGTSPEVYPARSKEECRKHMGYDLTQPILGFASADSFLDVKIVLEALAIVAKRFPGVRLIMTGSTNPQVLATARQAGVFERLILPGFLPVEELSWCLGSSDVFLLPFPSTIYNNGRWPNKVGVYFCLARPVVSNPTGDIQPLFSDNKVGLMTEYTPEAYAHGIMTLLDNPEAAQQMGQNGYELATSRFLWKNIIGDLENFYYHILEKRRNSNDPQ